MVQLTINGIVTEVQEGTSVLDAAQRLGIHIPTMCFLHGLKPSTSCMVCMVQDKNSGKMLPACSYPVHEGLVIETDNDEIHSMRKCALELLLSDHAGDCEAPCQRACPAGLNIPLVNRLIAKNDLQAALNVVHETMPLPGVIGYICPAPCEKTCRRKDIDQPVSICLIERYAGEIGIDNKIAVPNNQVEKKSCKVAVIGSGPMGLSAAFYLQRSGIDCVVFEKNGKAGGALRYQIPGEILPGKVLNREIEIIESAGVKFKLNYPIDQSRLENEIVKNFDAVVLAIGSDACLLNFQGWENGPVSPVWETSVRNQKLVIYKSSEILVAAIIISGDLNKMAARAIGMGRTIAIALSQLMEKKEIVLAEKKFNSTYGKLRKDDFPDFLKESGSSEARIETNDFLTGYTTEQATHEAKRCLRCDCRKDKSCQLRALSQEYKANQREYELAERKPVSKTFYPNNVIYEAQKCIKCGICIQLAEKAKEEAGFTFIGRGFDVQVTLPFTELSAKAFEKTAAECVTNCPTGALAFIL